MRNFVYGLLAFGCLVLGGGILPASAQRAQDALYIFRNDGQFNAFFWGDIQRFAYSKVDTLGVEHDDYVVQEVYALDSVFRLPVSAIDSIAFVTPETKYKSDVVLAAPQIVDYIVAGDSASWIRLSNAVPASLMPKKGSKYILNKGSRYTPQGFGGLVTAVNQGADGYTVTVEPLEPEEVYERAIIKMAASSKLGAEARGPRHESGYDYDKQIELEPYKGTVTLSGTKDIINTADVGVITSGTVLGTVNYDFRPSLIVRSFLSIGLLTGVNFDNYIKIDVDMDFESKIAGTLSNRFDLPYPNKATYFRWEDGKDETLAKILWKAGMVIEGAGTVKLENNVSGLASVWASGEYYKPPLGSGKWTPDHKGNWNERRFIVRNLGADFSLSVGLMAEASIQAPAPWLNTSIGSGLRTELVHKLAIDAAPLYYLNATDNLADTYWTDHIYEKVDKDDIVSYGTYASLDIYSIGYGWQTSLSKPTLELLKLSFGYLPAIYDLNLESQDSENEASQDIGSYKLKRILAIPAQVGFAVLDEDRQPLDVYWRPEKFWNVLFSNNEVRQSFNFDPIVGKDTHYYVFPVVKIGDGKPVLYNEHYKIDVDSAYFSIQDDIELKAEEGQFDPLIETNIAKIEVSTNANWLDASYNMLQQSLTLNHQALPEGTDRRSCVLHIVCKNSKGNVLITKDVPVTQLRPVIKTSVNPLKAAKEGGTYTVTLSGTALNDIQLETAESFLHPTYKAGVLTIVVDPNTTGAERQGTIIIKGATPLEQFAETTLTVKQAGDEVDPSVAHVSPTALTFTAKGGTQTVQAFVGSQFNRTGYYVSTEGQDWISVENFNDYHLEITAKPNTTGAERTCTVTVYMAKFEGDNPAPGTKTEPFPITITQAAGGISVNACTLSATAMMQEQTTGATSTNTYGESFASPNISVTLKGTSLHVVATNNYKKDYDVYQNVLEFDITSVGGNFANCKVENLEFRHIYNDTYVDWTSPGVYGKGDDVTLQLTNLRWQESKSNYTPGAKSTFVFSGTVADGVKFGKLTQTKVNYSEDKPKQVFNYVENQGNSATLTVELTIDPSALNY